MNLLDDTKGIMGSTVGTRCVTRMRVESTRLNRLNGIMREEAQVRLPDTKKREKNGEKPLSDVVVYIKSILFRDAMLLPPNSSVRFWTEFERQEDHG
jgi:hypothetical protein